MKKNEQDVIIRQSFRFTHFDTNKFIIVIFYSIPSVCQLFIIIFVFLRQSDKLLYFKIYNLMLVSII